MENTKEEQIAGYVVDILSRRIFPGIILLREGRIHHVREVEDHVPERYILPGFIDAHIHIESTMMIPSEFARMAVRHGTVATVSDPHEIGNVLGVEGVEFMIENGNKVPFKFYFGAPSCVPATAFETAGAEINVSDIKGLMSRTEIRYLAEMMNWPGVLNRDSMVMNKIQAAREAGKPVDGHAPGLLGEDARRYAEAGISTDHECFTLEEALDKLKAGMKIIIREGSAARNFDALIPLMADYYPRLMFCSDDKHPDELVTGHINELVKRSLQRGFDLFDVLQVACLNPIQHYGLDVGFLRPGDSADFIVVDHLSNLNVLATYLDGRKVFDGYDVLFPRPDCQVVNHFSCNPVSEQSIRVNAPGEEVRVIVAMDGQLITRSEWMPVNRNQNGDLMADIDKDVLKIVVVNRYNTSPPAVAFIRGFGLKSGAISSTVAHDSHNIIAVGVDDESIVRSVNRLVREKGGVCAVYGGEEQCLPLPVAGLMSTEKGESIAEDYEKVDGLAKTMGSTLSAPFMTLSFMALLVIPELKLSDKGLFDGKKFEFVKLVR